MELALAGDVRNRLAVAPAADELPDGGELRLFAFPGKNGADAGAPPFVDVAPETDTFVAFPSWMRHEVLPVRVRSGAWADRRFAINCWIHRVAGRAPIAGAAS